ncbi:hypothetical protein [Natrinema gari]|uniref:Secreted glycoprotein n=1 Tax=Natrinema gari JCM 14663 TaxID=1230459 RepID=L9ZDC0_9EURY|nr:hypothetical protein [Natrinema gari]ELY84394.1 hypothetical protein C486_00549 [Natrinema gari JCM 14663]
MSHRELSVLMVALFVTSLVTGIVTADPPRPGTEGNGLTENESATLWSRDADSYINQEEYQQRYGENRTAMHQLANGTDITFTRPPETAATWTRNDFGDIGAGGADTSVHPPHADLEDGVFIEDAHATVFAAQPSTRGHLESGDTPLYIAPNGTMRGFVDYRVRVPNGSSSGNMTIEWSLTEHEIEEVRLKKDSETIRTQDGSHTPALDYQIEDDWSANLTLEAEIHTRLKKTTRINHGDETDVEVTYQTESLTVSDGIDVEIYDLSMSAYNAEYPNGDAGVAMFQSRPWQGYTLTEDGDARVRGIWRFYTARNTNWDRLVRSGRTSSTAVESDAIPVYVHAYPSRIGPRAEPVRDGPEIIDTWGTDRPSPVETLGENINIDIVNQSYTTTYGVAVRAETVDRDALQVGGIVRGVNASIVEPDAGSERNLRRSNLTAEVLQQNESQATLRIELRDNETGVPIVLSDTGRQYPIGGTTRNGYITVAEQRVETNACGVAIVTIDEPGIYTARYHPGSWLGHNPAYVSETATARWHPLGTIDGWFAFIVEVGWQLIPFFVMFYAGQRLLRMLGPEDIFQRNP